MGRFIPNIPSLASLTSGQPATFVKVPGSLTSGSSESTPTQTIRTEGKSLAPSDLQGSNPLVNAWLAIDNSALQGDSYTQPGEMDRLQLAFLEDGSFTVQKQANYATVQILGRSEPVRGYAHSTARAFSIQIVVPPFTLQPDLSSAQSVFSEATFKYDKAAKGLGPMSSLANAIGQSLRERKDARKAQGVQAQNRKQIFLDKKTILNFLSSLVHPHYNSAARIISPPPPVFLIFGEFMWVRGIVTSVQMKHSAPYDPATCTPYFTYVSLSIEEANRPWSFRDAFTGKADKVF